jgi:hypothetical protein
MNRKPKGNQVDAISRISPFVQTSFDLSRQDAFVTGLGVDFIHYKAIPSPIGQKDRGDYRRSDGVDTITSNGYIYRCAGVFTAAPTDNARSQKTGEIGTLDPSESMLVLPRFYNKQGSADTADGKRIYLAPGDRIYLADPNADTKVPNHEKLDYEPSGVQIPMFPIVCLEEPIIDSLNQEYTENVDFVITKEGNVKWLPGGKNPGIDPDTGKGRIYSIRYLYKAYWYVTRLPKEIRMTNVTTGGVRKPERMPSYAVITREYIYHNQNKGDQTNQLKPKEPKREQKAPIQSIDPNKFVIPVDMATIQEDGGDGEQS